MEEILANIDPLELHSNLQNAEFRKELELYGFDVEELVKTVEQEVQEI